MRILGVLLLALSLGCTARRERSETEANVAEKAVNRDPKGSLQKIYRAFVLCESKTGIPPEVDSFDKYLKEYGTPSDLKNGIEIRWGQGLKSGRDVVIAWQDISKNGKYYALFASGRIDLLDEDEMDARGVTVGKNRERYEEHNRKFDAERKKENEETDRRNAEQRKRFDAEQKAIAEKNEKSKAAWEKWQKAKEAAEKEYQDAQVKAFHEESKEKAEKILKAAEEKWEKFKKDYERYLAESQK